MFEITKRQPLTIFSWFRISSLASCSTAEPKHNSPSTKTNNVGGISYHKKQHGKTSTKYFWKLHLYHLNQNISPLSTKTNHDMSSWRNSGLIHSAPHKKNNLQNICQIFSKVRFVFQTLTEAKFWSCFFCASNKE